MFGELLTASHNLRVQSVGTRIDYLGNQGIRSPVMHVPVFKIPEPIFPGQSLFTKPIPLSPVAGPMKLPIRAMKYSDYGLNSSRKDI